MTRSQELGGHGGGTAGSECKHTAKVHAPAARVAGASRHHAVHVEGPCLNVQAQAEPRKPAVGEGHLRKWGPEVASGERDIGAEDTHPPPPAWT